MTISADSPGYKCREGMYGVLYYGDTLASYASPATAIAGLVKTLPATDVNDDDTANLYDNTDKSCGEYASQQSGLKSGSITTTIYRHFGAENTYEFFRRLYRNKERGLFCYASGPLKTDSDVTALTPGDDGFLFEGMISSFSSAQPINGLQTVSVTITKCRHIADLQVNSGKTLEVVDYSEDDASN